MIAVIADDFTGAAEIGGLAFSFGYKVAIITNFNKVPQVDVLVVATDLRSCTAEFAAKESERITSKLLELNPELIYKKIDSVLRGNKFSNENFKENKRFSYSCKSIIEQNN